MTSLIRCRVYRLKFAVLAISLFSSYWSYFLGAEIVSSILMYTHGRSFYHVLSYIDQNASDRLEQSKSPLSISSARKVPLIMHRMWRDYGILDDNNEDIPANWTKAFHYCHEMYRKLNWTTVLWTDDSLRALIEKKDPSFLPIYDSYPYDIQRVDAARYYVLYHYGGVYMDLDVVGCNPKRDLGTLTRSMEQLGKGVLIPLTYPMGFSNDVMFASKEHEFFAELINALPRRNRWFGTPYLTVMFSTGPMFLSLVYMRLSGAKQEDVLALPPELYSDGGARSITYFKHLRGSTWHGSDAHMMSWVAQHWSKILFAAALVAAAWSSMKTRTKKVDGKHK